MHMMNSLLGMFGFRVSKLNGKPPKGFLTEYSRNLKALKGNQRGLRVFEKFYYEGGEHPSSYVDYECAFAAAQLIRSNAKELLDVGSYRHFTIGLLSHFSVTSLDIRGRAPISANENVITCDAVSMKLPRDKFDVVLSLSALEHFGLGRYGDKFDLDADIKAFNEMVRVLKPKGRLIFTTTITRTHPSVVFNAHRVYDLATIKNLCSDLVCEEERFYSHELGSFCPLENITAEPGKWDVYCGCYVKN